LASHHQSGMNVARPWIADEAIKREGGKKGEKKRQLAGKKRKKKEGGN